MRIRIWDNETYKEKRKKGVEKSEKKRENKSRQRVYMVMDRVKEEQDASTSSLGTETIQ